LDAHIASIDNVDSDLGRQEIAKKLTLSAKGKYDGWIFIKGGPNTGRTYVTAVLCNKLFAEKDLGPIAFLNSPERIKELNDLSYSKEKDKFEKTMNLYQNIPVLVFDDFGNGYVSDYIRDAIIQPIIAKRAQKRLLTIFTSDYSIDEIGTLFTTNQNAGAIRAEQIKKILKALCGKEINLGDLPIY
jgi:primosomal protein DnaI